MPVIMKPDSITSQIAELQSRLRIMENTQRVTPAVTQAGWGVNKYKMRVYQVGAQNIPDNSSVVQGHIAYDTVSYDTSNAFDAVNHQWVTPLDGYYFLDAELGFTLPAIANAVPRWELGVYVNGVASEWGPLGIFTQPNPGVAYFMSASVTESLFLNKGDTVFIEIANVNGGGVWPVTADSQHTYWSMHLIST